MQKDNAKLTPLVGMGRVRGRVNRNAKGLWVLGVKSEMKKGNAKLTSLVLLFEQRKGR